MPPVDTSGSEGNDGWDLWNIRNILDFADNVDLSLLQDVLKEQIEKNTTIASEDLRSNYGAQVGQMILEIYGNNVQTRARAKAAAGSDARMGGCSLPVVINSGSGNQGMTVSSPVIEYAKELCIREDALYRALIVSNMVSIYQRFCHNKRLKNDENRSILQLCISFCKGVTGYADHQGRIRTHQ